MKIAFAIATLIFAAAAAAEHPQNSNEMYRAFESFYKACMQYPHLKSICNQVNVFAIGYIKKYESRETCPAKSILNSESLSELASEIASAQINSAFNVFQQQLSPAEIENSYTARIFSGLIGSVFGVQVSEDVSVEEQVKQLIRGLDANIKESYNMIHPEAFDGLEQRGLCEQSVEEGRCLTEENLQKAVQLRNRENDSILIDAVKKIGYEGRLHKRGVARRRIIAALIAFITSFTFGIGASSGLIWAMNRYEIPSTPALLGTCCLYYAFAFTFIRAVAESIFRRCKYNKIE